MSAVTIVTPDVSENCLGRALLLAELIAGDVEVRIVGVQTRPEIWAPARSMSVPVLGHKMTHAGHYATAARWLSRHAAGSRVIVSKPRPSSLGLALLARIEPSAILLDIDDWEVGFRRGRGSAKDVVDLFDPTSLNSYLPELALDALAKRFPHRMVSNNWLARRFGGALLPHVRDTSVLDPGRVDRDAGRRELDMTGRVWVGFIGTVRAHKGVDDLVDALSTLHGDDAPGLYLAGVDASDGYVRDLVGSARKRLGEARVRVVGQFPFSGLPRAVALPDIICLPSRDEPGAWGQIPAKLFDALAMGKPVVASRVNDIAEIVGDAGVVFEPGDIAAMTRALLTLAGDDARRAELGRRARARAVEHYSYDAARRTLHQALADVASVPAWRA